MTETAGWPAGAQDEQLATAILVRVVEMRLLELVAEGRVHGTVHTCIGQEWIGVLLCQHLTDEDVVLSGHRGHGHYIAHTDDVEGLIAEVMGRSTGTSGGRGGSQHLIGKNFFSGGVQGGMVPVSAGLALARKLEGSTGIAVVFVGDGTLGEGVVYETLNLASKWRLPILFVVEDNGYAQSTPRADALAGEVVARAEAFGVPGRQADTWDVPGLRVAAFESVETVRRTQGPVLLHVKTYRLAPHSKGDDTRDPLEVNRFSRIDVINRLAMTVPEIVDPLLAAATRRVEAAVAAAEAAPVLQSETALEDLSTTPEWSPTMSREFGRGAERLRAGLRAAMRRDGRVFLFGEDITGVYGGAFKVTAGLDGEFPGRVRSTPISEAAMVGTAVGLALAGWRPIFEIMFGDFLTLAADQFINQALKLAHLARDGAGLPVLLRTPMGGRRGYGPTHSQSLEKMFLGLPGSLVLAVHHRFDPAELLDRLLQSIDRPTLLLENKALYGSSVSGHAPRGWRLEHTALRFPTSRLKPEGPAEVTIVCYGGMLTHVEEAVVELFDEHEIIAEVICPMQIHPLDLAPMRESVSLTGRLLFVEEGQGFCGLGSEIAAQLLEQTPGAIQEFRRVSGPGHPVPASRQMEEQSLPGSQDVVDAVRQMCRGV